MATETGPVMSVSGPSLPPDARKSSFLRHAVRKPTNDFLTAYRPLPFGGGDFI